MNQAFEIPIFALFPFLLMLASIAVLPLSFPRLWDKNRNKLLVALVLSVPTAAYLLHARLGHALYDTLVFDYVPFIILLGALFVITGGIFVEIRIAPTPAANTVLLAVGALLASVLGTTGAAMLLIRSVLHVNRSREFKAHTLMFFIATVCNCGGLLTPLGDPPLFMMYLRGAPFEWFLKLTPEWLTINGLLLIVYFLMDTHYWKRERPELRDPGNETPFSIELQGKINFFWLLGVVLAIALINDHTIPALHANRYLRFLREGAILLMAVLSLKFTTHLTRMSNSFTWHPIEEVAYLFLGIFVTMAPCLLFLEKNAHSLNVASPAAFYYASGLLSSFLDNTPTAVTFYSFAQGLNLSSPVLVAGIPEALMKAICTASVLFGAMTYIGNGPNFMVKTIAEHQGIRMPHFFDYIWRFGLVILLPLFILMQLLFIRGSV
jgi:Na+/H+ antiporter NhaD/arsenite permease-like protein